MIRNLLVIFPDSIFGHQHSLQSKATECPEFRLSTSQCKAMDCFLGFERGKSYVLFWSTELKGLGFG